MATGVIKTSERYLHDFAEVLTTTDDTVTTVFTIPVAVSTNVHLQYIFSGTKTDFTACIGGNVFGLFRRGSSGNITRVGAERSTINRDNTLNTCDCYVEIDNTGYNLFIRVKGKAATSIKWTIETDYLLIT